MGPQDPMDSPNPLEIPIYRDEKFYNSNKNIPYMILENVVNRQHF